MGIGSKNKSLYSCLAVGLFLSSGFPLSVKLGMNVVSCNCFPTGVAYLHAADSFLPQPLLRVLHPHETAASDAKIEPL